MKPFEGILTALVTPFKNQKPDDSALRHLVDWQIENGIHGLVPCGTTGESPTLSLDEKKQVIEIVIEQTRKRVPVIAGTGSNHTQDSIALTSWAKDAGADAALVVTPYYNKPSQQGLIAHYQAIAEVGLPLILYHVPGRTAATLTIETVVELSKIPNIIAIKDATANLDFASETILHAKPSFTVLSGDDFTFLPLLAIGGKGIISVVSNVVPRLFLNLYLAFKQGDLQKARNIHFQLYPLLKSLFIETNPVPVKTALAWMKKIELEFRLPLCPMTPAHEKSLRESLSALELI
ncbi:MAG: 4-hydroxy-tetrahydrodipicolinate synthase [Deltaproteobacteria bacterium]|nr:4-hydroxy-tetrahydrodipicolinate synthase [Deltaproteobacteria bacterium]